MRERIVLSVNDYKCIEAIIFLHGLQGITETFETALQGWRALSDEEKQKTMNAYVAVKTLDLFLSSNR